MSKRSIAAFLAVLLGLAGVAVTTAASAADTLLSQGKPALASSQEGADVGAEKAFDGDAGTRWSSQFADPQWIRVDLGAAATISRVVLQWEGAYGKAYQIQTSADGATWTTVHSQANGAGGTETIDVTGSGRYVRLNGTARNSGYGYSLYEFKVYGGSAPTGACTTNAAQGKPATASSSEGADVGPDKAVDGNTATRWSSQFADPQWIRVDLGATTAICRVVLRWEGAYARAYQIQTSADGATWTTVHSQANGAGGTETIEVTGSGRYVRLNGTARASGYGYSLWEFQVLTARPPTTEPPAEEGDFTTVWTDTFDGAANTSPSTANWIRRTGTQYPGGAANWGTGSVETASDSTANVYLDGNGKLNIKAIRDGSGKWTSGRIETQRTDFAPQRGELLKFTAVLKQPDVANAAGYWPGFRATGAAYRGNYTNWPGVGETDIMTGVNGRNQLSQALHCGTAPGGPCNEYDGRSSGFASCTGCQTGFHEYTQVIDRTKTDEEIRFYLDGRQTWVVRESQVGVAAWEAAVHHGFYLRFDLAIGGSLPNAIAGFTTPVPGTTSGGVLSVDSVTVSRKAGATAPAMTDPPVPAGPSVVKVTGSQGNWQLTVNGTPWEVKGMTYGPPQAAADGYMRDLKNMGVNTIRIWGPDANTPLLLDTAARHGIKVVVGLWLNHGADYVNDTAYKTAVKAEIVAKVNELKGRSGVLLWDVGNEVILEMQNYGLSAEVVEARRVAYAKFVNEVAVAIHAADANHPVTSTDAYTHAWTYYKPHAPALDLLAVNSYGAIDTVKRDWIAGGYTKPYILTEGGPAGEWEVPNDVNGVPNEPSDLAKKAGYTYSWNAIKGHPGVALGATEFHYGLENDFGGVWLNTTTGGWRRLGYHAMRQAYTGQVAPNTPPEITAMTVGNQTAVPAGGTFTVSATATDPQGDLIRYNLMASDKHITANRGLRHLEFTQTGNGQFTVRAPEALGVWKVYVYAYDGHGNVGIEQRSFKVVPPTVAGTNLARGRTVTASSHQPTGTNGPQLPSYAVDGDYGTRWASEWVDTAWLQVDLGSVQSFNHVQLAWEAAYATAYTVQTSADGSNWTTVYSTSSGNGGFDQLNVSGSGRYVRVNGSARATSYGYSLYELGVYRG
ncbi:discoidin domain-containing protein [Actinoplanes aureus]|uniref:Discoidin domain-containing protein n=1 Tax=Actinoplanes aureus TaxID=2792083 RepID=A0A931CE70_9ACTN|nr:discoidin domain-containing protein [Actinoplanes aureus]MBG0564543.1 discoidin domain-containing protein [Actinoplanes aureus]